MRAPWQHHVPDILCRHPLTPTRRHAVVTPSPIPSVRGGDTLLSPGSQSQTDCRGCQLGLGDTNQVMSSKFHTGPLQGCWLSCGCWWLPVETRSWCMKQFVGVLRHRGQFGVSASQVVLTSVPQRLPLCHSTNRAYVEHPLLFAVSKPVYWEHRGHGTDFQTPFPAQSRKKKKVGRKEESNFFPVYLLALC